MAEQPDSLLARLEMRPAAADSLEGQRLHRTVRARLLDETIPETRVDRFVILERLGVGGMGVVYAAHDPELDRKVAIKLVRHWDGADRQRDQERLIREARTLAQLSHPNVVAIYDVGLHGDRVFVAMELVQGTTLRRFVSDAPRAWEEVLRCLVQAGEGLAAAHAVGIVHRDLKPDNVLVGNDPAESAGSRRVRVVDFGLAHGEGSALGSVDLGTTMMSLSLTATGKVVGTPAYMAPEQFEGAPADPRTDQFSFCVTCWEALFRERPFPATSIPQLRRMIAAGLIATPSEADRVPDWLRAVLERGLAADPATRWPSMRALVEALTPRRRRGRSWRNVALLVIGTALLSVGGFMLWQSRQRSACSRDANEQASVWNGEAADAIVEAFSATGLVHAGESAERVGDLLDDYARAWAQTHERGCLAHLAATIDDAAWQRRRACLDDRRERLAALVEVLRGPDREVVNAAMSVTYELPLIAACEDDARLAANAAAVASTLDPERVAELRRSIARAELLADAKRSTAVATAEAARDRAEVLGDPGLVAEAQLAVGAAHLSLGDYQPAADAYESAYFVAHPLGADEVALLAATRLVEVVGSRLARYDEGLGWSRHAEGLLARSGNARPWREARLAENVAAVLRGQGDLDAAREHYERAIALRTEFAGPDHPAVGHAWAELGAMLATSGIEGATPALDEAERILVAAYGRESMEAATVYSSRGSVARYRGDHQASADHFEQALAIREALLEPDHPSIAPALSNLAAARLALGDLASARALLVRVSDLQREKLGPLHPSLANALANLGMVDTYLDDPRAAVEHFTEALEIRRHVLPPNHPDIATSLNGLSDAYRQLGEYERALASSEEAVHTTQGDPLGRVHGRALTASGMARLELGDVVRARADFEAALATAFGDEPDPTARCGLPWGLARALVATEGTSARVRDLARATYDECRAAGVDDPATLDDLDAWARGAEPDRASAERPNTE